MYKLPLHRGDETDEFIFEVYELKTSKNLKRGIRITILLPPEMCQVCNSFNCIFVIVYTELKIKDIVYWVKQVFLFEIQIERSNSFICNTQHDRDTLYFDKSITNRRIQGRIGGPIDR